MCLNFWEFENSHEMIWNFAKLTESLFVVEKTWVGLPRTNLRSLAESPRFHLHSFKVSSMWFAIICNFAYITKSLAFDGKISLVNWSYTSESSLEFIYSSNISPLSSMCLNFGVCQFSQNALKLCTNDRIILRCWKNLVWITHDTS